MSRAVSEKRRFRAVEVGLLALLAQGCGSCGGGAELRGGPHPYRACLLAKEPDVREVDLGGASLVVEGRRAALRADRPVLRVAAFRGADDELDELTLAASAIDEEGVDLLVVLGGVGRKKNEVVAHLEALSRTKKPIVLVPGGDESLEALDDGIGALDRETRARLVDGRSTYVLELGGLEWVLVPGAPAGRYAHSDEACGYDLDDLDARLRAVDAASAFTFAWAEPTAETGLPTRGVFAFPGGDAPDPRRVVVGPLAGPPHFLGEGYRESGPTLLEIGPEGPVVRGLIDFRGEARVVRPPAP